MKLPQLILIIFSIVGLNCEAQTSISQIEIIQPSIKQEATSIWRTINDYTFFEEQGYTIHLPEDSLIDSLIIKSKNGAFGNEDFPAIYSLLETKVFDQKDYLPAIQKIEKNIDLIHHLIDEIEAKKNQWDWDFKMFDTYNIVLTLYGTGGSYDPDEGTITLLTNKEGSFKKYKNPTNTIIHEITHMGIEYSIVKKYNIPHGLKERIVDTLVYLLFHKKLPEYKIQQMGDNKIDKYLATQNDIKSLDDIASRFANK